ncbi:NADH-quinone oxidoreductase subunit J [Aliarcobacter skirrowii]|jgi:NADH-quinone oxidoreductase subunit J|uniref:NADH-quinone oxidoreductase subunit J n=2 Tax=Aliarcobacter skirrowii TaxID=28200 RepID=A0AAD0SNS8_9BACT|nr:NADH-quinone oxidoreductase subunit J [Aliarcobacter skirrowii]AXX85516.1 NADH:quinone oxidoreductase I, membrane subunit J [Aliarcobacter skirrowii CCUG 10374]AZL54581.1 NADH-quinone oxidoreductase subunit J [Aliarcobacter skirrowii]KAB0621075.1 NADH-quinone oxidoreductase subunit J [Aliarcobacter skirrowii CCUG 10374]MCT7446309.1 NADH-quinone oxidoreductase subunit J [Aliarcobacter skirrowii]MDD3025058.1 NADH-quinone oxidoreductase subunit J [Aliarcobacter skirrowii]
MADIIFIALAFFAITGAIAMLVYKSPMYSALGLLITMLSIAGMFALLNATLLFMVQIIVYAGAIMALLLFILMFLNIKDEDLPQEPAKYKLIALGVALMIPLNILVLKAVSNLPSKDLYPIENSDFGDIKPVGMILYNEWIIAFELISILLLIALVGSVVLAKKRDTKLISKGDE